MNDGFAEKQEKILVTGGADFVGSNLANALLSDERIGLGASSNRLYSIECLF